MSQTTGQFKKQLPRNAFMSILAFGTHLLSAVWLTPYLVRHLGAAAYGLIPIAGLFTQYVSVITVNLAAAVNRFLAIELQKPDGNPNAIFNSSLALYSVLILLQLPLFALGLFYADHLFSIPPELKTDALLLLGCSGGAFLISLLSGVFGVSIYSKNRLDINSSLSVGRLILRLCLVVLLFSVNGPRLRYIGYIDLGLNTLMLGFFVFYWKKLTPELSISLRQIKLAILKPVFKMSAWTLAHNFGSLLYYRTDVLIINRFISPVLAGQYAAILVISNFIQHLSHLFGGQFGPVTISYWAKGEHDELRRLLSLAMKLLGIGLAIITAVICGNGREILTLWLGLEFAPLAPALTALCLGCAISATCAPLRHLQVVSNSVKFPALVMLLMGIINIAASYFVGVSLEMGPMGVASVTAVCLFIQKGLFNTIYGAYIMKLPCYTFWKPIASGVAMLGVVWLLLMIPSSFLFVARGECWQRTILVCALQAFIGMLIGLLAFMTKEERSLLINMLPLRPKNTTTATN